LPSTSAHSVVWLAQEQEDENCGEGCSLVDQRNFAIRRTTARPSFLLFGSAKTQESANVCLWAEADDLTTLTVVEFRGLSGRGVGALQCPLPAQNGRAKKAADKCLIAAAPNTDIRIQF
jgi:hypothetical protein